MNAAFVAYAYLLKTEPHGKGYRTSAFQLWKALRDLWPGRFVMTPHRSGKPEPAHPKTHLHYCPPHVFSPMKGKRNVLFTMWEAPVLPPDLVENLKRADVIVVPSEWNRATFEAAGLKVAAVIPLGVNPVFLAIDPTRRRLLVAESKLRILWAGSTALRKNWPELPQIWERGGFDKMAHVEMYVKTLDAATEKKPEAVKVANIIYDNRVLDDRGMATLYGQADIFVGTSLTEGFGLQPLEAMAAGALYCGPDTPGTEAFIREDTGVIAPRAEVHGAEYAGVTFGISKATVEAQISALRLAISGWGTEGNEARRLKGVDVARRFLWTDTAAALYDAARD